MNIKNIAKKAGTIGTSAITTIGTLACGYDAAVNTIGIFKGNSDNAASPMDTGVTVAQDLGLGVLLARASIYGWKAVFTKAPAEPTIDLEKEAADLSAATAN